MPVLRGITVEVAVSGAGLTAYADPNPHQEPGTSSSYIEVKSNRWFAVFVRVPQDYQVRGDVFVAKVFLNGRRIAETWRQPGEQLPSTPQPEGVAGFEGDMVPTYEPGLAQGLREMAEQQRAHDDAGQWLMQGRIAGMPMRFPHVVTDNNPHEPGDAAEWEGKEIVVQFHQGCVLEKPSKDAWGNYVPGKVETVGDVLAFTFKHRPLKILNTILGHPMQSRPSAPPRAHDPDSPHSDKTIRPPKGKDRANSIDSDATLRPKMPAARATKSSNECKAVWNGEKFLVEWLTATQYASRMHDPKAIHPADEQWKSNLANFNSTWLYCCKRMRPASKFVWCDNATCEIGNFHFRCVGLTSEPHWGGRGWLCPVCNELPEEERKMSSRG